MEIISSLCLQHKPEILDINGANALQRVVVFHLEIFSSTVLHLWLSNLPWNLEQWSAMFTHRKTPKTMRVWAVWNLVLVWQVASLPWPPATVWYKQPVLHFLSLPVCKTYPCVFSTSQEAVTSWHLCVHTKMCITCLWKLGSISHF